MLMNFLERWLTPNISLTDFNDRSIVLRYALRLSGRMAFVSWVLIVHLHLLFHALGLLPYSVWQGIIIGTVMGVPLTLVLGVLATTVVGRSITALADARLEYLRQSRTDMLSGLPNRRAFTEALAADERGVLLLLDIDRFKQINDRCGHLAGDDVIVAVAHELASLAGDHHLVARIGGEEFAVLFRDMTMDVARQAADQVRRAIEARVIFAGGQTIRVSVSGGLAAIAPGRDYPLVYSAADKALYLAKGSGRNRIVDEGELTALAAANPPSMEPSAQAG
ncbi:MAG: GGDEF domain-containing protein [Allorhizobium sp.]